jgi:hypothetical protein
MAMVGIEPAKPGCLSLLQGADVSDEILNLFWFQAFAISRHFAFAVADDCGDRVVTLSLHIRGTEIPDIVRFANGGFSFPVSAMTGRAFCFVESLSAGLRLRGDTQKSDSGQDDTACDDLDPVYAFPHVFLLIRKLRGLNKISLMPFFRDPIFDSNFKLSTGNPVFPPTAGLVLTLSRDCAQFDGCTKTVQQA